MKNTARHLIYLAKPNILKLISGFTLIEALVAAAILGLLCSILFPSLSAVREKSRQIKCLSNLKQVGLACSMYAQENSGILFLHFLHPGETPAEIYLPEILKQKGYLNSTSVCFCPSCPVGGAYAVGITYGMRNYRTADPYIVYDGGSFSAGSSYLRFYDPPQPSDFYLFVDSVYGPTHTLAGKQRHVVMTTATLNEGGAHTRHNGVANALFLDGHVEGCMSERLKAIGFTRGFDKNLSLENY
ncbi:MAG: prepilin-type N-terminal cleavage/methylation domain-containing protein [Verrucomicrobiae bacterium]|nr:prepilin-type N-terminal cleavage/methylation domain-containing protein [Verrucomicrobiae bacterium]